MKVLATLCMVDCVPVSTPMDSEISLDLCMNGSPYLMGSIGGPLAVFSTWPWSSVPEQTVSIIQCHRYCKFNVFHC